MLVLISHGKKKYATKTERRKARKNLRTYKVKVHDEAEAYEWAAKQEIDNPVVKTA